MSRFADRFRPGCGTIILLCSSIALVSQFAPFREAAVSICVSIWNAVVQSLTSLVSNNFPAELLKDAIVTLVILGVASIWRWIPKSIDNYRARLFWGSHLVGDGIALCFGSLTDSRLLLPCEEPRFVKRYRDGRQIRISGPSGNIIGLCEIRAASYLITTLSRYRSKPVPIEDDQTCLPNIHRSIVAIGSAASNEITQIIESESWNKFLCITEDGDFHCLIRNRLVVLPSSNIKKDFGMILKIRNSRFPGNYFFVCAGLGEWGTSGAAWYLAEHWKELDNFGDEFGCVVAVEIGSDRTAKLVHSSLKTAAEVQREKYLEMVQKK